MPTYFCERCGRELQPDQVIWLEFDQRTHTYHDKGGIPVDKSQGGFPFGKRCAELELLKQRQP
jgi:hypothetical protein